MTRLLVILFLLLGVSFANAQSIVKICQSTTGNNCISVDANNPLNVTGTFSTTITFPTIGAAVPSTGIYNALNVAGTLRGWSGISTGSIFPGTVAIVDASGNQITSFGSTTSNAPVAAGAATATTSVLNGCQYLSALPTFTTTQQGSCIFDINGRLLAGVSAPGGGALALNSTLGSPFQAGGSIGNTSFAATQATAASLNATVVGTGTFAVQAAATATEVHVGEVGGNILPITNDITTTNATTTTGQSIGGLQTLANAVRVSAVLGSSGTSGMIQSVIVSFKDAVTTSQIDVFYFNASPSGSTCTNDSAFILADADRDKVIGVVHVTDFTAGNTAVVSQAMNQALPFGVASATSVFACLVARGSFAITGTANASLITRILRN